MYRSSAAFRLAYLCLAWATLSSCAGGRTAGEHIADKPHWMGGLPNLLRRAVVRPNARRRRLVILAAFTAFAVG
jgi:hypothetical protein